ncbi:MAG: DUF4267 domain-containing protein [Actinomycetota bacterium]
MHRRRDPLAMAAGTIRAASGVSFLIAPIAAGRLWGADSEPSPRAALLLRSMGYRDALIGGLLLRAGLQGEGTAGWFLASAGADTADLIGGLANHDGLDPRERRIGIGGAAAAIAIGLIGAARARSSA